MSAILLLLWGVAWAQDEAPPLTEDEVAIEAPAEHPEGADTVAVEPAVDPHEVPDVEAPEGVEEGPEGAAEDVPPVTPEPEVVPEPEPTPQPEANPDVTPTLPVEEVAGPAVVAPAPVPAPLPVLYDPFVGPPQQQVVVMPSPTAPVFFPTLPMRGFLNGLLLLVVTLAFGALSELLGRVRDGLDGTGILPTLASGFATLCRALAVFFGLGVVAAWAPASVAPVLPWVLVGGALALGWSARDVMPDVVAWLFMTMEGRVRPGRWVSGENYRGEVVKVGLRATTLLDDGGGEVAVPNRLLIRSPYTRDASEWPLVSVTVSLPSELAPEEVRSALREAVALSPWVAPGDVQILADTLGQGQWSVRARLLEGTYLAAFEGSLRERVVAVLGGRERKGRVHRLGEATS